MKKACGILTLLTILFALSLSTVIAKDTEEDAIVPSGMYVINAESGSFEVTEDDTLQLTLESVPEFMRWLMTEPNMNAGRYGLFDFGNDWRFASEEELLETQGILATDAESITLILSDPVYNAEDETLTYNVQVDSINVYDPEVNDDKAEVPETFASATLFVPMSDDFNRALLRGRDARLESARLTTDTDTEDCTAFNYPNCDD